MSTFSHQISDKKVQIMQKRAYDAAEQSEYNRFRRTILIGMLVAILLGTLFHFVYDLTGKNWLIGLFFPINESCWEHLKLVFWPMTLLNLYSSIKYRDSSYHVEPAVLLGTVAAMLFVPVLFYTYRGILGFGVPVIDMLIYYISMGISLLAILHLVKHMFWKEGKTAFILLWTLHLIIAALFFSFTYQPPELGIFRILS